MLYLLEYMKMRVSIASYSDNSDSHRSQSSTLRLTTLSSSSSTDAGSVAGSFWFKRAISSQ